MNSFHEFFAQYPVKQIPKGEMILHQDDNPKKAYMIKRGIMKVYNLTSNGEEKSLSFKVKGDLFPLCWIFSKTTSALFFYEAHTDCEVYVLDRKDIIQLIDTNHEFAKYLIDRQIISYVNSELKVDALEQSRSILKLLYTFRHLALTHGVEIKEDRMKISIPLTQQDIANSTGLTRETTAIALKKLIDEKVVFADHKLYVIDTEKVNERIDDEYDPGITIQYLP